MRETMWAIVGCRSGGMDILGTPEEGKLVWEVQVGWLFDGRKVAWRMARVALIQDLLHTLSSLKRGDDDGRDRICRRTELAIRKLFGVESKYLHDLRQISFYPLLAPSDGEWGARAWESGTNQLRNLLDTMVEDLRLGAMGEPQGASATSSSSRLDSVFIVHGKDEEMKQAVARTAERLGVRPVILHEQPNQGRTIIEKFTDFAVAPFAIVLLSGDDMAYRLDQKPPRPRPRARQNVILELGYFLGKLGSQHVFPLYREMEDFEMPSDYAGVVFTPFDPAGRWQLDLVRELQAAGYRVDANALI